MSSNVSDYDGFVKCLYPYDYCNSVGYMTTPCPSDTAAIDSCAASHNIPACVSDGFKKDIGCLQSKGNIINSTASYSKVLALNCPNVINPSESACVKHDMFVKCLYSNPGCGTANLCPTTRADIDKCAKDNNIGECVASVFKQNLGCLQNYTKDMTEAKASYEAIARIGCPGISLRYQSESACRERQCSLVQSRVKSLPNCLTYSSGNNTSTVCCQKGDKVAKDQTGLWSLGTGHGLYCSAGTAVFNGDTWCISNYVEAPNYPGKSYTCMAIPKFCNASGEQCSGYPGTGCG
jgi:hypothetical protein